MINKPLSIIIPAFNEELAIKDFLVELLSFCDSKFSDFEIIVVNDASTDNTKNILDNIERVKVVNHPYNKGNGAAVRSGIRAATKEFVVMMDADGQHRPEEITLIVDKLGEYDCVVGARTEESSGSIHRNLANKVYNSLATYVTNMKIEDLTSGFRGFRRDVIKKYLYLFPNGFSYPTTSTLSVIKAGYNITYVPIVAKKRLGKSKIKLFRDGFRFLLIIVKLTTLFSPMKIFLPASLLFFISGLFHGIWKVVILETRYTQLTVLLLLVSIIIFFIGLLSEQIATLRFDKVSED